MIFRQASFPFLALTFVIACGTSDEDIGVTAQASTFPSASSWVPVQQAGGDVGDIFTDGGQSSRELVGDSNNAAVFIATDGVDFFVRMRLDEDPTGSGANLVQSFGWGLLIDTDNNLLDYEYIIMVDGSGNPDRVLFSENTVKTGLGNPSDSAETPIISLPLDLVPPDHNVVIQAAGTSFNSTPDFFLDFSLPLSAFVGTDIDLRTSLRFIAGTSNSGNAISVDIMSCSGTVGCTIALAASDPTFLDGSSADPDGDGVPSPTDLDDDNDGIADIDENDLGVNPDGDADSDGIANWQDASNEGDGSSQCVDLDANGICDAPSLRFDDDQDGVPNHLDTDSDNDGIVDFVEAGHGATDANGDGLVDGPVGLNGLVNALETGPESGLTDYVLLNTDGDADPDFLDLDSDGDGLFDLDEVGGGALDVDDDGRVDSTTDLDRDGLMASVDGNEAVFGVPAIDATSFDVDGDSIPSPYDVEDGGPGSGDSDADGISDAVECAGTWPACADGNTDGQPDYMRPDLCGNSVLNLGEGCDDGDTDDGDGCSSACLVEDGLACNTSAPGETGSDSCASGNCDTLGNAAPGVCEPLLACGNGILEAGEGCDDGNTSSSDGCDASCLIEDSSACSVDAAGETGNASCASGNCDTLGNAAPGVCEPLLTCGNGILEAGEGCDDGNLGNGDNCDSSCLIEDSLACNVDVAGETGNASCASGNCDTLGNAAPGVCEPLLACGNGVLEASEGCDDGNTSNNDGCDSSCRAELGAACNEDSAGAVGDSSCASGNCDLIGNASPGVCEALLVCGNGILEAGEGCDDGGNSPGDGCDGSCLIENGSACNDDAAGALGNSSCASSSCDTVGSPSPGVCQAALSCGNSILEAGEGCDDGGTDPNDGCDGNCLIETGTACNTDTAGDIDSASCASGNCDVTGNASPGICETLLTCGNGILEVGEGCDDGNTADGDTCSASCLLETGSACNAAAPGATGNASCASDICDVAGNAAPGICEDADTCGNGALEAGEGCDDGNTADGDDCNASCLVEDGSSCNADLAGETGSDSCASGLCDTVGNTGPGVCEAVNMCGNGVLEAGEGCDDGNALVGDDCDASCLLEVGAACNQSAPGATGDASCASDICDVSGNNLPGLCEAANTCGNGVIEGSEACDDGNTQSGDACDMSCRVEEDITPAPEEYGIQGGGCSTSGPRGGTGFALLVVAILLCLARRPRCALSAMLLLMLLPARSVQAQQLDLETDYPVERFRLSSDGAGILDVEWAAVTGHKVLDLAMWLGWADDPLTLNGPTDEGRGRVASLVSSRMAGNLLGSIGLYDRVQLGIEVPLILYQGEDVGGLMETVASPSSFGLGDLRLVPKIGILRQSEFGVNVAAAVGFTLPTSSSNTYFGESAALAPEILVSRSFASGVRLAANIGMLNRKRTRVLDLIINDELQTRLGLGYRFADKGGPPLELDISYALATGLGDILGAYNRNYSEIKAGANYDLPGPVGVFAGAGLGTSEGFGTPDWRVLAGLRFRKELDKAAAGPLLASVIDSDGDGLDDSVDPCPQAAENRNSFQDDDGCPDEIPDSDGDGLDDLKDLCPSVPEDFDRFEDDNGCPDPDNDGDGFVDLEDLCPDVSGVAAMKGCPDPDRDGDTVVDRLDNCPDEAGNPEFNGCNKRQLVALIDDKLDILDVVYFQTNKATILSRSFGLLDNVAEVLADHSELQMIRVEGHTDSQGNDDKNKALSQRRAEAVVAYLVSKGVPADRLQAAGFGEEQPIADNTTKEGRAANRRVEFKIVGDASGSVEEQRTGPGEDSIER